MSKWFLSRYQIRIASGNLTVCYRPSLLRQWVLRERSAVLQQQSFSDEQVLTALNLVRQSLPQRFACFEIMLANTLCRFVLLPVSPGVKSYEDLIGIAKLNFRRSYGVDDADWDFRIAEEQSAAFVAAALPRALLLQLTKFAVSKGNAVLSVRPELSHRWPEVSANLTKHTWRAVEENEQMLICGFEQGRLKLLRQVNHALVNEPDQLKAWIKREVALQQLSVPEKIEIFASISQADGGGCMLKTINLT